MRHPSAMRPSAPTQAARPWAQAWQAALYAEDGFYRRAAPAAHFATSAQGIPGGGELLARAVVMLAERHGCSRIVDLGCGRGELLARLRVLDPGLHLTGVDVVERPEGLEVDTWIVSPGGPTLPAALRDLQDSLVLAHEWLDVVPCPVVARDEHGVWRAPSVHDDGTETLGPVVEGDDLAWAERWLDGAVRGEVGLTREAALADLLSRVQTGLVVVVDYGHETVDRPVHGTLTGFRGGREVPPVPDGSCDLTAHLAIDALRASLARAVETHRQRDLLTDLLGDPAPPVPHDLASTDPAAYLAALARRSALATLTGGALGDFWWLLVPVPRPAPPPGLG